MEGSIVLERIHVIVIVVPGRGEERGEGCGWMPFRTQQHVILSRLPVLLKPWQHNKTIVIKSSPSYLLVHFLSNKNVSLFRDGGDSEDL